MHVFCIFVFAPVQCNGACFTWKGALKIRSLSLLLDIVSVAYCSLSYIESYSCSVNQ